MSKYMVIRVVCSCVFANGSTAAQVQQMSNQAVRYDAHSGRAASSTLSLAGRPSKPARPKHSAAPMARIHLPAQKSRPASP